MSILRMSRLLDEQKEAGRPYLEFLHTGHMSAGIYVLPAGAADLQKPHAEEEIYYVIRGKAFFWRMTAAGPATQPSGKPPARILPKAAMSGTTP